tara:strand:- start:401 stop:946 length:546 start_codon:yes stop_codon:yes gene_type:complete
MYKFFIKFLILLLFNCIPIIGYTQTYPVYKKSSTIAVLDQDALFSQSNWGLSILNEVEKNVTALAAENRLIENELETEELSLTEARKLLSKKEFDVLALEFDTKVKEIREIQASKQVKINIFLNEKRNLFFKIITPILLKFIDEMGVEVLLNKDTVALASLGSDITNAAIIKINEKLNKDN